MHPAPPPAGADQDRAATADFVLAWAPGMPICAPARPRVLRGPQECDPERAVLAVTEGLYEVVVLTAS
jgi:hypothetical protein